MHDTYTLGWSCAMTQEAAHHRKIRQCKRTKSDNASPQNQTIYIYAQERMRKDVNRSLQHSIHELHMGILLQWITAVEAIGIEHQRRSSTIQTIMQELRKFRLLQRTVDDQSKRIDCEPRKSFFPDFYIDIFQQIAIVSVNVEISFRMQPGAWQRNIESLGRQFILHYLASSHHCSLGC